ncbi:hypothetical protein J6590_001252 [Homalodisca vitripennis]|nr:hypothetical protein J6590_001252 [Homalodisca vitripennis]
MYLKLHFQILMRCQGDLNHPGSADPLLPLTTNSTYSLTSATQSAHSSMPGRRFVAALASLSTPTLATISLLASHSTHIQAAADGLSLPSSSIHVPVFSSAL